MKTISLLIKYLVIPASTVIGLIYGFDTYVIERAKTVVQPTEIKVNSIEANVSEIAIRTRNIEQILMSKK